MPRGGIRFGQPDRVAKCGHPVPYHPGMQRNRCDACAARPRRSCGQCAADITNRRTNVKFCSQRCGEISRGVRLPEPLPSRICALAECDVRFTPASRSVRCCSERHGKIQYNRESRADGRQAPPKWDDKARARWKARYALTRGAPDAESFDYREVYDRDGWVCGICSNPVDPEAKWPDPMSVSLDHIIPVSWGGRHSRDNAQCSHLRCNVRKGAAA
jgi:hypothetical protein